ncbi:hypothetical protein ACFRJ1_38280 [Streptomyces sp. NPDC056773]|uniref:hypothetical protein n=1 Tax=unclassified Streptomyces TaxID=2593676 RepID=UPI0036918989
MTRKTTMTVEQRRAYSAEMRSQLEAVMDRAYGEMVTSDLAWLEVMRAAAALPDRTPTNVMAIAAQRPGATRVMAVGDWRKIGRYPAKGSSSIRIWTPIKRRPTDQAEPATTQGEAPETAQQAPAGTGRSVSAYKAAPVFDISQTDGDDCPPDSAERIPAERVRDILFAQYVSLYGHEPAAAPEAPEAAAQFLLLSHALRLIPESEMLASGQYGAEAVSAAHVAALTLGLPGLDTHRPPLAGIVTDDRKPPVHASALRVIETGRGIAEAVTLDAIGCDIHAAHEAPELITAG